MDLEYAKKILLKDGYSCVLVKDDSIVKSRERGVKPLMQWLEQGICLVGFSAADKVVGKATAFLYVHLGVCRVYAGVMSRGAVSVFEKYGVSFECENLVDAILNRRRDGFCPMETAVRDIDNIDQAMIAITHKYRQLNP